MIRPMLAAVAALWSGMALAQPHDMSKMDPKGMEAMTPSNRAFSPPEEMAALCAFLVSDDARAFHGAFLLADEGISSGVG